MLTLLTYLALTIPGADGTIKVEAPEEIPTGGLQEGGAGALALTNGISLILISITVLSLFFVIFGGIKWIMSGGDKTKLDSARKTITYAIIGLVLAFISFFIISFVGDSFGIDLLGR